MSQDYDNTNKGMLARNQRRENSSQPEYRGFVNIGGVEYWVSAWVKECKRDTKSMRAGDKFFSLAFTEKEQQPQRQQYQQQPRQQNTYRDDRQEPQHREPVRQQDLDDDIPF